MATKLTKAVARQSMLCLDHRTKGRDCDNVTVTMYPNNMIGFRAKRCRTEHVLPLEAIYALAIKKGEKR